MFETLLFLLLCSEMNISDESLIIDFHPDYPAFLSDRQANVLFKRSMIIFVKSNPVENLFLPETVKLLTLLCISLQTCVNNNGDNLS